MVVSGRQKLGRKAGPRGRLSGITSDKKQSGSGLTATQIPGLAWAYQDGNRTLVTPAARLKRHSPILLVFWAGRSHK